MKFMRVAGLNYSAARKYPYEMNPSLISFSYEEQLHSFFNAFLSYGDSLTHFLKPYGYSTAEILYDVEVLQKKWAEENGCRYSKENWLTEILIGQIQHFKPDILFLYNSSALPLDVIKRRKDFFPFVHTLIVFRGYPEIDRSILQLLSYADLLLVGSPVLEKICTDQNLSPQRFHHYFDDRILPHLPQGEENKIYPLTFIGTSGFGHGWNHQPRYYYLSELLKKTDISCWLDENQKASSSWKEQLKRKGEVFFSLFPKPLLKKLSQNYLIQPPLRKMAFNGLARKISLEYGTCTFPSIPLRRIYSEKCQDSVFGLEMSRVLASSKITLNKHTFAASGTADNIRLFEATGMGTCLLTDSGSNLPDLFEVDREIVSYSSLDECLEKIRYLMEHDAVRMQIAQQGQIRTLRNHTASSRARQLHELLQRV